MPKIPKAFAQLPFKDCLPKKPVIWCLLPYFTKCFFLDETSNFWKWISMPQNDICAAPLSRQFTLQSLWYLCCSHFKTIHSTWSLDCESSAFSFLVQHPGGLISPSKSLCCRKPMPHEQFPFQGLWQESQPPDVPLPYYFRIYILGKRPDLWNWISNPRRSMSF